MTKAAEAFTITRRAIDPRADGAVRDVRISAARVTIDRTFDGIRMRLGVPTAAYRELVISVRAPHTRAELRLRHDDSELDAVIGSGNAEEVARSARAWSAVTGKAVKVEIGSVVMATPLRRPHESRIRSRRTKPRLPRLLGRFAARRKPGIATRLAVSFAGESEIIARS